MILMLIETGTASQSSPRQTNLALALVVSTFRLRGTKTNRKRSTERATAYQSDRKAEMELRQVIAWHQPSPLYNRKPNTISSQTASRLSRNMLSVMDTPTM